MHPSGSTRMHIDLFCNTTAGVTFRAVRRKEYSTDWLASLFVLSLFFFFYPQRKGCPGAFLMPVQPLCLWPVLMSRARVAAPMRHSWTRPCAHFNCRISPCTRMTSVDSSRGISLSSQWWWPWSMQVRQNGASASGLFFHHTGQVLLLLIWYVLMACKISRIG